MKFFPMQTNTVETATVLSMNRIPELVFVVTLANIDRLFVDYCSGSLDMVHFVVILENVVDSVQMLSLEKNLADLRLVYLVVMAHRTVDLKRMVVALMGKALKKTQLAIELLDMDDSKLEMDDDLLELRTPKMERTVQAWKRHMEDMMMKRMVLALKRHMEDMMMI